MSCYSCHTSVIMSVYLMSHALLITQMILLYVLLFASHQCYYVGIFDITCAVYSTNDITSCHFIHVTLVV